MADEKSGEAELFYHFLGQRLESGEPTLSVEEAVAAFQDYQRDAAQLQQESQPADDDADEAQDTRG